MMFRWIIPTLLLFTLMSCQSRPQTAEAATASTTNGTPALASLDLDTRYDSLAKAYFASGCFWCTEAVFERVRGVADVRSGYTGGPEENPTYEQVSNHQTGHAEAVVVYYDPEVVSYEQLVEFFFASHDPTQVDRQGPDVGKQYRSGIFYLDEAQRRTAEAYKQQLDASGKYNRPIATEITAAGPFYLAEDYHQDYYARNPNQPYVYNVSRPKVEKFEKEYAQYLKPEYQ